ncbi:MAG: SLC13 family permease [Alphaproteobacteria bacterium]
MEPALVAAIGLWGTFAIIAAALALYAWDRVPMEFTSLAVICALLLLFHFFPAVDAAGRATLGPERLLAGFANPALLTVAALLVLGQGLAQTGALERAAGVVVTLVRGRVMLAPALVLVLAIVTSAFLNNTPVVVLLIPVVQAIAERLGHTASRLMIPLSYAAILGGMTTLIGTSTNLLVSGSLVQLGLPAFSIFQFTAPGAILAGVGALYIILVAPRLLPDRMPLSAALGGADGRQFLAQIAVTEGSRLAGIGPRGGFFPDLRDVTVRLVQRDEHAFLPPFDDGLRLLPGDVLVVAATRRALTEAMKGETHLLDIGAGDEEGEDTAERDGRRRRRGEQQIAEVMVTPASRLVGQTLELAAFRHRFHVIVLGIQRQSRMIRARITEIRLEAGDVLLIQGTREEVEGLRGDRDVLLIEWSATVLPATHNAKRALAIFGVVVLLSATELVPIVISSLCGAGLMLAFGILNIRQAGRAVDRNIVLLIAAALALGTALQDTGGAAAIVDAFLAAIGDASPLVALSAMFLVIALMTNLISNNAAAVLFTPIAVGLAQRLGAPVEAFAVAVVFAANCSFATPIGYQTNLMVMAPGNYRFVDFFRAGAPLVVLMWLAYTVLARVWYGL